MEKKIILLIFLLSRAHQLLSEISIPYYQAPHLQSLSFEKLAEEVESRTSVELDKKISNLNFSQIKDGWFWIKDLQSIKSLDKNQFLTWLRKGGFIVIENYTEISNQAIHQLNQSFANGLYRDGEGWSIIPPDHELMRSFYLLDGLPSCADQMWYGLTIDQRLAGIALPFNFLERMSDQTRQKSDSCKNMNWEKGTRTFVNLLMVVLTTDYKMEQIHLPEILKRLRREP